MEVPGITDLTNEIKLLREVISRRPGGGDGDDPPKLSVDFSNPALMLKSIEDAVKLSDAYKNMDTALGMVGGSAKDLASSFGGIMVNQSILQESSKGLGKVFLNLANESYATAVAFNAGTGAGGEFNEQVIGLRESLAGVPVSAQNVNQALITLYKNFADFGGPSGIQESELAMARTIAILSELGAGIDDQVGSVRSLRIAFRQNDEQIDDTLRQMVGLADVLNMDVGSVISNLNNQLPTFSLFGDKGVEAFKRIQAQAKATNIDVEKLVGISEKFITIEDTAQIIGTIRQVLPEFNLGFDISADALEGNSGEVLRKLSDELQRVGAASLKAGGKRLIAQQFNVGLDAMEALYAGSIDRFRELSEQAAPTQDLDAMAAAAATQEERLQAMLDGVAGMKGLAVEMDKLDQRAFINTLNQLAEIDELVRKEGGLQDKITKAYAEIGEAVGLDRERIEEAFRETLEADRAARERFWSNQTFQLDGRNLGELILRQLVR